MTALRCSDVDMQLRILTVNKALSTDRSGALIETTTKTKQSRRVPISEPVAQALAPIIAESEPQDFLFRGPAGGVLHYKQFMSSVWKPAVDRLGIGNFGFHGLRRTCASLLISLQTPITAVSAIIGHTSVRTTFEAYAHFYEDDKVNYLNKIAEGF